MVTTRKSPPPWMSMPVRRDPRPESALPHSVLFPPQEEDLEALAARAGSRIIVVCGDPEYESGRLLAAELMEAGLEQIYFVEGGCAALMGGEMCQGPAP